MKTRGWGDEHGHSITQQVLALGAATARSGADRRSGAAALPVHQSQAPVLTHRDQFASIPNPVDVLVAIEFLMGWAGRCLRDALLFRHLRSSLGPTVAHANRHWVTQVSESMMKTGLMATWVEVGNATYALHTSP